LSRHRASVCRRALGKAAPKDEIAVRWDDPAIGIAWPVTAPVLSARDAAALPLAELHDRLPRY
jgi:dTDP-4-dehydrorhamnose 3,5-epimerase